MSTEQAFKIALRGVRESGIDARANDPAVIAAHAAFTRRAKGKEDDPRFEREAPTFARQVILKSLMTAARRQRGAQEK